MRTLIQCLALTTAAALLFSGCAKKDDSKKTDDKQPAASSADDGKNTGDDKADENKAEENKADEKSAADAGGLPTLAAGDFFKDFKSLKGMEVFKKYGKGVIVNGNVLKTITELNKSTTVWLDAGEGNWVSLKFADKGEAAQKRGVKTGDELKAQCKVGGAMGKYVATINCALL